eukprot:5654175-Amphidinium_carterae.1
MENLKQNTPPDRKQSDIREWTGKGKGKDKKRQGKGKGKDGKDHGYEGKRYRAGRGPVGRAVSLER